MYIDPNPTLQALASRAFGYTGRKYEILPAESVNCASYWDSGNRSYYAVVTGSELRIMPEAGGFFSGKAETIQLTPGNIIIQHKIGLGEGITFYVHPSRIPQFLPASQTELTRNEKIVLIATRSLKSSYAGISNYRFIKARRETSINAADWEATKADLISKGYLNKTGALATAGKNATPSIQLYQLKG